MATIRSSSVVKANPRRMFTLTDKGAGGKGNIVLKWKFLPLSGVNTARKRILKPSTRSCGECLSTQDIGNAPS